MTSPTRAFELEDLFHSNMSAHALVVFNAIEDGASSRPDLVTSTNLPPLTIRKALAELLESRMIVCTGGIYKLAKRLQGNVPVAEPPKGTAEDWLVLFNRLSDHLTQTSQMIHAVLLAALKDGPTKPENLQLSCGEESIIKTLGELVKQGLVELNSRTKFKLTAKGHSLFEGIHLARGAWQTLYASTMSDFSLSRMRTELGVLVAGPASTTRLSKKLGLEPDTVETVVNGLVDRRRVQVAGESTPVKYKLRENARRDWDVAVSRAGYSR